mmetsp:Transcript_3745/g.8924  ORF Transcript_3745/g.8924 Transcript_3745/m.8924 type:complete len:202 (-) Transcript_3745:1123-1728(-)
MTQLRSSRIRWRSSWHSEKGCGFAAATSKRNVFSFCGNRDLSQMMFCCRWFRSADLPIPICPSITIIRAADFDLASKHVLLMNLTTVSASASLSSTSVTVSLRSTDATLTPCMTSGTNTDMLLDFPLSWMFPAGYRTIHEPIGAPVRGPTSAAPTTAWKPSVQSSEFPYLVAFPASRAAMFTVSPMTVYSHRVEGLPTKPQ